MKAEDGSEVKFWSVFYERKMLIGRGAGLGKKKEHSSFCS